MELQKMIEWYKSNVGKHTYSMETPRFDCSFSVASALEAASGAKIVPMSYSTINLGDLLKRLGFVKVYSGRTNNAPVKEFDVILMTNADSMSGSGGAGGHTGIIGAGGIFWNTTPTDWSTGNSYLKGKAVQSPSWSVYRNITRLQHLTEVWRYQGKTTQNKQVSNKITVDGLFGVNSVIALQSLAGTGSDGYITYITSANKKYLPNLCAYKVGNAPSLTVIWLQKQMGATADGFWGKDTNIAIAKKLNAHYGDDRYFGATECKALQKWINERLK